MLIESINDLKDIKLVNNTKFQCKCEICKKEFTIKGKTLKTKKKILCLSCSVKETKKLEDKEAINEKRKKTNLERFGQKNTLLTEKCRNELKKVDWQARNKKSEITNLKKYGVKNPIITEEVQNRIKQNNLKKYGVEWTSKLDLVKNKQKNTNIEKYGAEYYFSSETGKEKIKSFWKDNYNVENASQANYVKEKLSKNNPMKNETIKMKSITNRSDSLHQKIGYTFLNIHFDSSWELAYFIWLKDNKKSFIYHPNITFNYIDELGIERTYFPDFLVEGEFIEIKGNQFFNEKDEPYNQYKKEYWWNKFNALKENNVKILRQKECLEYVKYIHKRYGQGFLKQFKN